MGGWGGQEWKDPWGGCREQTECWVPLLVLNLKIGDCFLQAHSSHLSNRGGGA